MTSGRSSRSFRLPRIDGRPGPAHKISDQAAAAIVDAALARYRARGRTAPRLWRYAAAAALVCALAGVSTAALVGARGWRSARDPSPASSGQATGQPHRAPRLAARIEETSPATVETAIDSTPARDNDGAAEPRRIGRAPRSSDLIEHANRLRRRGEWRAAEKLYARVGAESSDPWAGYIAKAAAASIRLEQLDDPRGALRLYRQALAERPEGELGPEVLWGIAGCERALGALGEEASALRDLVARYPASPLRARAERRLAELAATNASAP
jgi:hypothetical protein